MCRDVFDEDEEEELMRTMDIVVNIDHPAVVKVLEFFEDGRIIYLVMEYMAGGGLFDKKNTLLPPACTAAFF